MHLSGKTAWFHYGNYSLELSRLRSQLYAHVEFDGHPQEGKWYGFRLALEGRQVMENN